jgi:aryl-alcohol dehydrogenase-like predicted oxidoreductase
MKVSVVGFPGLALAKLPQEQATAALHKAFDRGLNYYDVAPNYGNGDAEIKMGVGLQGLDRSQYFLSCKTHKRDKAGAQMTSSLARPTSGTRPGRRWNWTARCSG